MEQQINEIKINMAEFKKDISYIKDSLDENSKQHKDIKEMIVNNSEHVNNMMERNDTKYANKWVEKAAVLIAGVVATAVVGAVLSLIILE